MKRCLFFVSAVFILFTLAPVSCGNNSTESDSSQPRAAIIDQLYLLENNTTFTEKTTQALEDYGFEVDLWQGKDVTVDLYRELPEYGYKLIIFRVHSGLLLALLQAHNLVPSKTTYLFTGETYTTTKYTTEQLNERVTNAMMTTEYPLVFAINSEFIINDMKGTFDNTVIIAMGCESHYLDDMATAFVQRGASAYIGWDNLVSLKYVDKATLTLISNLSTGNMTMEEGIDKTMGELGYDPYFHAQLKSYPPQSGIKTIRELIE
ncbi:hypothetical protein ACFLUO_07930 [Chloroflexota bacterium]